jgi:hypothetical protein
LLFWYMISRCFAGGLLDSKWSEMH